MHASQLAINSISTKQASVPEMLDAYASAGFGGVEFYLPQVKELPTAQVVSLLGERGLTCIGGFEFGVEVFSTPEKRSANQQGLLANARLLAQLSGGAPTCLVVGTDGPAEPVSDPLGEVASAYAEVAALVQPYGVSLCLEFNWSPLVKSLLSAVEVARRSGAANVGVLFDPAHYHCTSTKMEHLNAQNVPFIKHVHLNDMRDKPGELSNCNSDRELPGAGCLPLREMISALEGHGYAGRYSIEMFSPELWALPTAEAASIMYRSLLPFCT